MTVEELNVIVRANQDDFDRKMRMVNENLVTMKDQAGKASAGTLNSFKTLATGLSALGIAHFFKETNDSYKVQMENELKLETIMKQRMGATDAEITQVKELASAQQQIGIIGDEVQLAGAQQIATFATQESTVKRLIPAMNNLLAQQNGYNSTTGDAVSIGNLMGKVLQGQTSALTRVGITFSEAQENILKYGTEEQKAATLAQVITDNVGDMNEALRNTPTGQMTALNNDIGDIKEQVGATLQPLISSIVPIVSDLLTFSEPVLNMLNEAMKSTATMLDDIRTKVEAATPAQQTMLKIAIGMAVAIPAVTAATRLMTAAKAAYSGILGILIPKQLTFASALKATMGWIGLIVGVLALFRIATNKGTEGIDDNSEKLEKENEAANKAAKGVDDVAESTDNLTDSVKRSLAGFDELNRLSGNSGTLASSVVSIEDVENADNLADALGDVQNQIKGLNTNIGFDFDFDLSKIWDQISSGEFGKSLLQSLATAITGETDTKIIDDALTNMFNDIFTGNWEDFSENIANGASKSEFVKGLLGIVSGVTDDEILSSAAYDMYKSIFSGNWSKVWENWQLGSSILQSGIKKWVTGGLEKLYGDNDIIDATVDFVYTILTQGGASIAMSIAKALGDIWKEYGNWVNGLFSDYISKKSPTDNAISGVSMQSGNADSTIPLPIETKKKNWADISSLGILGYADGGFPDYGDLFIANERGPELVGTIGNRTAVANSSSIETAIYNAVRSAMSDSAGGQSADIHVTVDIDGDTVGETVARYNAVRNRRLNGRS